MVVGAGRGPLVKAALQAAKDTQRKVKLFAIEKNPNAINTLVITLVRSQHICAYKSLIFVIFAIKIKVY